MNGADRIEQARREVEEAQRRLDELDETAREAGEFRDAGREAARREELERELDTVKEELRFAKEVEARREVAEIDVTVAEEGEVITNGEATGGATPSVNLARDPDADPRSVEASRPDLAPVLERAPWERAEASIGPLAAAQPPSADTGGKEALPNAAADREAAEKMARDREMFPSDAELEMNGDASATESESEGPREEFSPSVDPYRAQTPEELEAQIREAGRFVDRETALGEMSRLRAGSLFFGRPREAQPIDIDPDPDPAAGMTFGTQAGTSPKVIVPEAPFPDDDWKVRAELPPTRERQAHPAHAEPARQAHPAHGAPMRQIHPAHGAPVRQAHPAHGLVKKPVLIAALGLIVAVIGTTAVVARPDVPSAPVRANATLAATQAAGTATGAAAAVPVAAITPAPVGATLTVTPRYQFPVTEACPSVPGSQREVTSEGTAVHVIRLAPKTVLNPAPGGSDKYDFGPMTYPSARCNWSLSLDYERRPLTGAFVLFPPSTTYQWEQTQVTSAPGGGRQVATILIVTNGSR